MVTLNDMFLAAGFSSFIKRATVSMNNIIATIEKTNISAAGFKNVLAATGGESRKTEASMKQLGKEMETAGKKSEAAAGSTKKFEKTLSAIKKMVKETKKFVNESFNMANLQRNADSQLKGVLNNVGAAQGAFGQLKKKASDIQSDTFYSDNALMAGAGTLAIHTKDTDAIEQLMGTLSNYAAGMSKGGDVDSKAMAGYAAQLGQVFDGDLNILAAQGFDLSEVQKEIIQNGTDMEKALVIDEIINQSWAGLAEKMAALPENRIKVIKQQIGSIKEELGSRLTPAFMRLYDVIEKHLPQIEGMMLAFGTVLGTIMYLFAALAGGAANVVGFIQDNWSMIAPIITGIALALGLYYGALMLVRGAQLISSAATGIYTAVTTFLSIGYGVLSGNTAAASAAQFVYNSSLLACPLVWVIGLLILLIAVFFAVVAAVNKFTGSNISALGLIGTVLGVFVVKVANYFINLYNVVAEFINFFVNVWSEPVASVQLLFCNMALHIIDYVLEMTKAIETIINKIPGVQVDITAGLGNLKSNIQEAAKEIKDNSQWKEVVQTRALLDGADFVSGSYDKFSGFENAAKDKLGHLFQAGDYDIDFSKLTGMPDPAGLPAELNNFSGIGGMNDLGTGGNPATVKGSGANGAVKVENEEDIEWMQKSVERDYAVRIAGNTLAPNIKVEFTGPITKEADVEGVAAHMVNILKEQIAAAPEGVYV